MKNIRKEGATVSVEDMNYDDAVRLAAKYAEENNGVVVQIQHGMDMKISYLDYARIWNHGFGSSRAIRRNWE